MKTLVIIKNKLVVLLAALCIVGVAGCEPPAQQAQTPMGPQDFLTNSVFFFLSMLFVYWILVLRPKQVATEERSDFMDKLRKGDEVVTSGGLIGKVAVIKSDVITIEISQNIKIRVLPEHVHAKPSKEEAKTNK